MKPFSADPRYPNTQSGVLGGYFKIRGMGLPGHFSKWGFAASLFGLMFVNKSQTTSRPHSKNENGS